MGKVNFGVLVSLSETQAETIARHVEGQSTTAEKVGAVASGLLVDLADGGVMIPPEWAVRIQSAIGSLDPRAIIEKVEGAVGRQGDSMVVKWTPDPSWTNWILNQCEVQGITPEQMLNSFIDHMLIQGHLGTSAPDPFKVWMAGETRWDIIHAAGTLNVSRNEHFHVTPPNRFSSVAGSKKWRASG